MRAELRRRVHPGGVEFHHDVVLIAENEEESEILDELGDCGVSAPVRVQAEVRLSDDLDTHYVLLQPLPANRATLGAEAA